MKQNVEERRSIIMSCVRSKGNKSTELRFINIMKSHSIVGWRRNYDIIGKPDFVFTNKKIAVFIDGCFWHGCQIHCRLPATNVDYWENKIIKNKQRDRHVTKELKRRGWTVMRFWEHDLIECKYIRKKLNYLKSIVS